MKKIRSIYKIKKQMERCSDLVLYYEKKKDYGTSGHMYSLYSLLEWVLGEDNEWELRLEMEKYRK